jgi:hypothetical protein
MERAPLHLTDMRSRPRSKPIATRDREGRLRAGRAAAQTVRSVSPTTLFVKMQLRFSTTAAAPHASQSFVLYPGAKAYFAYPCPYGDCSGVYDLDAEATRAMSSEESRVTGTLECEGGRAHNGQLRERCGLQVRYVIEAQHEEPHEVLLHAMD